MREITIIHVIDGEDKPYIGWQVEESTIMELDNEGPAFSRFATAITGDTVRIEDAIKTYTIEFHGWQDGKLLAAMGGSAADLTLREIGTLLLNNTKEKERD